MKPAALARVAQFRRYMTLERNLSAHTDSNYARDLAALVKFCDARKLEDWSALDSQYVRQFAAHSHAKGLAGRSIQRRLSAVRSFFEFLVHETRIQQNAREPVTDPMTSRATRPSMCARPKRSAVFQRRSTPIKWRACWRFLRATSSSLAIARSWSCFTRPGCALQQYYEIFFFFLKKKKNKKKPNTELLVSDSVHFVQDAMAGSLMSSRSIGPSASWCSPIGRRSRLPRLRPRRSRTVDLGRRARECPRRQPIDSRPQSRCGHRPVDEGVRLFGPHRDGGGRFESGAREHPDDRSRRIQIRGRGGEVWTSATSRS